MAVQNENDKLPKLVTITRQCFIRGELAENGETVKVDANTAKVLVGMGKARYAEKGATEGKAKKPDAVTPAAPVGNKPK